VGHITILSPPTPFPLGYASDNQKQQKRKADIKIFQSRTADATSGNSKRTHHAN